MLAAPVKISGLIDRVVRGHHLTPEEAEGAMDLIMSGRATGAQVGSFLTALRMKGETVEEITGCTRVMRAKVTPVVVNCPVVVDTCGTGGDGAGTFNISTAAAFVVAGAGLPVAKHGNRSVSSRCGSADVLEALGINLELPAGKVAACIQEVGIGFLFAPRLHLAMKHAISPRREIGIRTIFNLLGPLTNPARSRRQVLGVYDPGLTEVLARVLGELGSQEAMVVHGLDGLDEISICRETRVSHLKGGRVETYTLHPGDLGFQLAPPASIRGGDVETNGEILLRVLQGERGPRRDVVVLNAAAALLVGGLAENLPGGVQLARHSLDSGQAYRKLEGLQEFSRRAVP